MAGPVWTFTARSIYAEETWVTSSACNSDGVPVAHVISVTVIRVWAINTKIITVTTVMVLIHPKLMFLAMAEITKE